MRKNNRSASGRHIVLRILTTSILLVMALAAVFYFGGFDPGNLLDQITAQLEQPLFSPQASPQTSPTGTLPPVAPSPSPTLSVSRSAPLPQDDIFNYVALDVGQADCHLIITPRGKTMLIDAGEKDAFPIIDDYLKKAGISRIDTLVATHPHNDHIGGMQQVVEQYEIGDIYMPQTAHTSTTYKDLLNTIKQKGKKIHNALGGNLRFIELDGSVLIRVLGPVVSQYTELNDYSTVLHMTYKNTTFLFTGDIEKTAEKDLLEQSAHLLKADVLKVPHHGSSTSSSDEFLAAVSPRFAVIPVLGGNSYNHPHTEVIARLNQHKINYYRTDLFGVIRITSDGDTLTVTTERG